MWAKIVLLVVLTQLTNGVKVSIFYEALCPDSSRFIHSQLNENYEKLKDFIQLEWVAFGKATYNLVDNEWKFECQHGSEECKGNKYQACAVPQNSSDAKNLQFINCIMWTYNPASTKKMSQCAEQAKLNWNQISKCASSREGEDLLAANGNRTFSLPINLSFVPTIIFDDVYDQNLQDLALNNFVQAVCTKIKGDKPAVCDNKPWSMLFR